MDLILSLLLLLTVALITGEIFERLNLPGIIGELLTGVILGPAVFGIVTSNAVFSGISDIALFFIILLIGIEATTETIRKNYRTALLFTMTSFIVPAIVMIAAARFLLGLSPTSAAIISISVAVPSISIISVVVKNLNLLRLNAGHVILASVIITDIVAFSALSVLLNPEKLLLVVLSLIIFLIVIFVVDLEIRKHSAGVTEFFRKVDQRERGEKIIFGSIIISGLVVSSLLEIIGLTFVLGAFFAGIIISEIVLGEDIYGRLTRTLTRLDDSFFIPIFFSIAGLEVVLPDRSVILGMALLIFLSGGIGALLNRYFAGKYIKDLPVRTTTGILGLRGSVGIVIATIAFNSGFLSSILYSMAIFSSLALDLAFSPLLRKKDVVLPSPYVSEK